MASANDLLDPKGLIRESYRIEGITQPECRSIFLDWALSVPTGQDSLALIRQLLARHAGEEDGHPMTAVLEEALGPQTGGIRRGGAKGRRNLAAE